MAAVRIESAAFADSRIELLGNVAGYNRYEALGRLAHLWRYCTERGTYIVSEAIVEANLGDQGVDGLLVAELGERVDGGIRVCGTEGRIEWLQRLQDNAKRGGEANAKRLAKSKPNGYPAGSYTVGANTNGQPGGKPDDSQAASQNEARGKPERSPLTLTPSPEDQRHSLAPAIPPSTELVHPRTNGHDSAELTARRRLGDEGWDRLNAIRAQMAADFKWDDVRPLHPQDPGRTELALRLRESGDEAAANLDHVLTVTEAEGRAKGTTMYLTGGMFGLERWRNALGMRVEDATRQRAGPRGTAPPEPTRRIKPL